MEAMWIVLLLVVFFVGLLLINLLINNFNKNKHIIKIYIFIYNNLEIIIEILKNLSKINE